MVCKGIGPGELVTIEKRQFDFLDVDRRYQRDRIGHRVNDLIEAIRSGGIVPDPVTLVKRTFKEPGIDPNKLWIIDGQQRAFAFLSLDMPFRAMLHTSASLDDESNFFLVMNNRTNVNSNVIVHTWPGHAGRIIRSAAADPEHPLYGRVDFKGHKGAYRASVLAAAVANAVNIGDRGNIQDVLARIDGAVGRDSHNIARSKGVLSLVGMIFPSGNPPAVVARALGEAAYRKWADLGNAPLPCRKCVYNVSRLNWRVLAPTNADGFKETLVNNIVKRWQC